MATDYVATNVSSGVAQQSTINAEWAAIQTALERVLNVYGDSTNGTNAMQADLDMNNKKLLNVPAPVNTTDVVRLGDLSTADTANALTTIITDAAAKYASDNVEGALAEILTLAEAASTSLGEGADLIGVHDVMGYFTGATVEEVLAEFFATYTQYKADLGSTDIDKGAAIVANAVQIVSDIATLATITPVITRDCYISGHTTRGDGGQGQFYAVTGAAPGTYVDNGGTIIVPGDGSAAWLRSFDGSNVLASWFGVKDGTATDFTGEILAAIAVLAGGVGGVVHLPAGNIRHDSAIVGESHVNLKGAGTQSTLLDYRGAGGYGLDVEGSGVGGFPVDRKILTVSDLTLTGINSTGDSRGVKIGHNYRSMPLLQRVKVASFRGHGLHFTKDNWNIGFEDVEVDQCGKITANTAGVYKEPALTDLNYINWARCQVEGCGSSTSTAGGLNITTTALATNRGWNFTDCIIEGNAGTDEVYISNMRAFTWNGIYHERTSVVGQSTGFEFNNVTGIIKGGVMAPFTVIAAATGVPTTTVIPSDLVSVVVNDPAIVGFPVTFDKGSSVGRVTTTVSAYDGAGQLTVAALGVAPVATDVFYVGSPQNALRLTGGSDFEIAGVAFGNWGNAAIKAISSAVRLGRNTGNVSIDADTASEITGDIAAGFSVSKGGTNQTAVVTGTATKVTFTTEDYDTTDNFTASAFAITSNKKFRFSGAVNLTTNADNTRVMVMLYRNGGVIKRITHYAVGAAAQSFPFDFEVELASGLPYEIWVQHESGSDKIISGDVTETFLTGSFA